MTCDQIFIWLMISHLSRCIEFDATIIIEWQYHSQMAISPILSRKWLFYIKIKKFSYISVNHFKPKFTSTIGLSVDSDDKYFFGIFFDIFWTRFLSLYVYVWIRYPWLCKVKKCHEKSSNIYGLSRPLWSICSTFIEINCPMLQFWVVGLFLFQKIQSYIFN